MAHSPILNLIESTRLLKALLPAGGRFLGGPLLVGLHLAIGVYTLPL